MWMNADELDRELFNTPKLEMRIKEVFMQFRSLKN
jgi:hypothetical protein